MDKKVVRQIRTVLLLAFVFAVVSYLIYTRVKAYAAGPTLPPEYYSSLAWYEIPFYYLWDYFSHAWICLLFAFTAAGLVYEFMPKEIITRYMRSSKIAGYALGAGLAPFFTVCSCTMVPLFAGIMFAGAGIGPAITFLLMAPAANILTILVTGQFLSWEVAGVRIIASLATAVLAGVMISRTSWGKAMEQPHQTSQSANVQQQAVELVKPPLDERLFSALKFGGFLVKQILPFFVVGLVAVSYVEAYLPQELVAGYLTGVSGVLLASVVGGPLYTPTLVEVALGQTLLGKGMSSAALLSWLMGQPYDIPNMVAVSRIVKWKVVLTYALIAWGCSVIFGLLYGLAIGVL